MEDLNSMISKKNISIAIIYRIENNLKIAFSHNTTCKIRKISFSYYIKITNLTNTTCKKKNIKSMIVSEPSLKNG